MCCILQHCVNTTPASGASNTYSTFKDLLNMELRWNSDVENVVTAHSFPRSCDFKTTLFPFDILASLNSGEPSPCTMSSSRKNNIQRWKLDWEIHSSKHFSKPCHTNRLYSGPNHQFQIRSIQISIIIFNKLLDLNKTLYVSRCRPQG